MLLSLGAHIDAPVQEQPLTSYTNMNIKVFNDLFQYLPVGEDAGSPYTCTVTRLFKNNP